MASGISSAEVDWLLRKYNFARTPDNRCGGYWQREER